jgi:hypothetical protein
VLSDGDGDVDECYDEADSTDSCSHFDQVLREEVWVRKCTDIVYFKYTTEVRLFPGLRRKCLD